MEQRYKVKGVTSVAWWTFCGEHENKNLAYYNGYNEKGELRYNGFLWTRTALIPIEPSIIKEPEEWL